MHYVIDSVVRGANPGVWNSFSPEDQQILLACAKEMELYGKGLSRLGMDDDKSKAYLEKIGKLPEVTDPYACLEQHGMTVTRLTPDQLALFHKATEAVRADWAAKIGPDLVKAAEQDMASAK